jgi:hypothetical protein
MDVGYPVLMTAARYGNVLKKHRESMTQLLVLHRYPVQKLESNKIESSFKCPRRISTRSAKGLDARFADAQAQEG